MRTVNVHQAKTHLSRLLRQAASGEEIVIASAGRPVARLVPLDSARPRQLGSDAGALRIGADFDEPLPPDVLANPRT